jgi:hypothetical protein
MLFSGGDETEGAVFDAFGGLDEVGEPDNAILPAFYDDYLKTVVVVKVNVLRGKNDVAEIVLNIDEFVEQFPFVMVIHYIYGADHHGIVMRDLFRNNGFPDKVFDCLGTRRVLFLPDYRIKLLQ